MRITNFRQLAVTTALCFSPALVQAHVLSGDPTGLHHGFIHPFSGLDHLLAMVAVGLWAAQQGGRSLWTIPAAFVGLMSLGGAVGMLGGSLPGVEGVIAASVLVFGLLIACSARFEQRWSLPLVGAFALFHGFAHGREMPASASGVSYAAGFILATIALHGLGVLAGLGFQQSRRSQGLRWIGAGMAAASVWIYLG
jgi:urease accessory protein